MTDDYYDRLNSAWLEYIGALSDTTVHYNRVVELRLVYESILDENL